MGVWNIFRVIILVFFGLLFLFAIGAFGVSYFVSNCILTTGTAEAISDSSVIMLPSLIGTDLPPELAESFSNTDVQQVMKSIMKNKVYSIMAYIKGETDTVEVGLSTEETKQIISKLDFPGVDKTQITDAQYEEMANSLTQDFSSGEDFTSVFAPLRAGYSYAKSAFYLSFAILLILVGLVFLINFGVMKSLFWLFLYFLINSFIWLAVVIVSYFAVSASLVSAFADMPTEINALISKVISNMFFKFGLVYFILLLIGVVLLVLFLILRKRV